MKVKKPTKQRISQYISYALLIYFLAILIASIAKTFFGIAHVSDSFSEPIIGMIDGAVGAIAAVFVIYELNVGAIAEKHRDEIEEAQFILEFNQAFIQDEAMCDLEQRLERWSLGEIKEEELIPDKSRQTLVNYLVYHESLASLVTRGILQLSHIDDLMAYRFFLAMNNLVVQNTELKEFPDYYKGCFKLYAMWAAYRKSMGCPILLADTSIDKWELFNHYSYNGPLVVRPMLNTDDLNTISDLIYDTDAYIYPALFGKKRNARKIMKAWLKEGNGIFRKENIMVATINDIIVGIVLLTNKIPGALSKTYSFDYPDSFDDVNSRYFQHIQLDVPNELYIACVSVAKSYQNQKIASRMVQTVLLNNTDKDIYLDVLANNKAAITVYEKLGFINYGEMTDGYAFNQTPEKCIQMVANRK